MSNARTGIWLIGAKGGVAAASLVGLAALKHGLTEPTGLVTAMPPLDRLPLADWKGFLAGGHEIRAVPLAEEAMRLATESRALPRDLVAACRDELDAIDRRIRPGTIVGVGPTIEQLAEPAIPRCEPPGEAVDRIKGDLADFKAANDLEHVVVVNVASTEPPCEASQVPARWSEVEASLRRRAGCLLPASTLYAIAALDSGSTYINFTPSLGSAPPALDELARLRGAAHMGCDGKTGETLLKSVLAPMFQRRHLEVLSWVGHNIFGNMDGQVLNDPVNKQTKVASKSRLLGEILGYQPQSHVSIEYIASLGDWKTAWDHIHFAGFLGTRMTLQFIWQGSDSLLAAPLVLDLVRLAELARRRGESGRLTFLASFFKSPYGVAEHAFDRQFRMLEEWAAGQ